MKYLLLMALVMTVVITPSCKKSSTDSNTTPREGLELLTNESDTNFCVLIIDDYNSNTPDDTIVWGSSAHDSIVPGSKTYGYYSTYYACCAQNYRPMNKNQKFQSFMIQFRQEEANQSAAGSQSCSIVDSMIKPGKMAFKSSKIVLFIRDGFGLDMSTEGYITPNPVFDIVSITRLTKSNGCTKLRIKAKLSDLQFSNFACRVPPYHIKEGLIQMDFSY